MILSLPFSFQILSVLCGLCVRLAVPSVQDPTSYSLTLRPPLASVAPRLPIDPRVNSLPLAELPCSYESKVHGFLVSTPRHHCFLSWRLPALSLALLCLTAAMPPSQGATLTGTFTP